jgi:hypothetical protein
MLASRVSQGDHFGTLKEEELCKCCYRDSTKKLIPLCCDLKDLHFLGPGYRLYFDFVKANMLMLFIIYLGLGINNTVVNAKGRDCVHLHKEEFKCNPTGEGD